MYSCRKIRKHQFFKYEITSKIDRTVRKSLLQYQALVAKDSEIQSSFRMSFYQVFDTFGSLVKETERVVNSDGVSFKKRDAKGLLHFPVLYDMFEVSLDSTEMRQIAPLFIMLQYEISHFIDHDDCYSLLLHQKPELLDTFHLLTKTRRQIDDMTSW